MKKIIIGLLIVISCVVGCSSKKQVATIESTIKDSTVTTKSVKIRDTTLVVPKSSVSISVPVSELNEKPVTKKSGNARLTLSKKDEVVSAQADCDSLQFQVQLRDSIISTLQTRLEKTTITPPAPEPKKRSWIENIIYGIGFAVLLVLAILGIVWLIQKFKPV